MSELSLRRSWTVALLPVILVLSAVGLFRAGVAGFVGNQSEREVRGGRQTGTSGTGSDPAKPASEPPKIDERGFINFGTVRFHPEKKIIEADGWFNMDRGIVEFLACAPETKSHETLVTLDVNPIELNFALLSLGLKPGTPPKSEVDLRPIAGDRVVVFLKFTKVDDDGQQVVHVRRAEDCLVNFLNEADMKHTGFVYTGSQFIPKHPGAEPIDPNDPAAAQRAKDRAEKAKGGEKGRPGDGKSQETPGPGKSPEGMVYAPVELGQFFALCHRPFAILDNPLALPYPDPEYGANPEVLPRVTREEDEVIPVTVIIRKPRKGEIDYSIKRMPFKVPEGWGEDRAGGDKTDGSGDAERDVDGRTGDGG